MRLRALLVTVGLVLAGIVGVASPATASTGGYSWADAVAVPLPAKHLYEWGYTTCPTDNTGCMAINDNGDDGKKYGLSDPWGYYMRNCTSWVASKLAAQGFNASGMGMAADWGNSSKATNHVDDTPAVGAVAWWGANKLDDGYNVGSFGHVAYVTAINGSLVTITEYNYGGTGVYHTRNITPSGTQQVQFIHLADITSGGGTTPPARAGIQNGGFNDGMMYWSRTGSANMVAYGPTGTYEGDGYGVTNAAVSGDSIRQDVALSSTAGHSYCASAQVRTDGSGSGAGGSFAVWLTGGTSNENSVRYFSGLTSDWTPIEACVTATSSHTTLRIQIYPTVGAPTLAVDAVDMHESLLNSAGFNGSSSGWARTGTAGFALYGTGADEGTGYGAANAPSAGDSIYQNVTRTITTGATYCVDAQVKSNISGATSSGTLALWMLGSSGNENSTYRFTNIGNDWTPITTCVTATGAHTSLRVQFYPDNNTPTIGMDAAALHPTLAANGGFNNGTSNWSVTGSANIAGYGPSGSYEGTGYGATNASASGDSIRQDVTRTIDSGDMYCVSAKVRTNGSGTSGAAGTLALWMMGGGSNENSTFVFSGLDDQWTPIKTCVTATTDHTSLRIQIFPTVGAPTLAVDAVDMG